MAGQTNAQLRSTYLANAYLKLRTFDKTINIAAAVYLGRSGVGVTGGTAYGNARFQYVNAGSGTYSTADLPSNIGDDLKVYASDIQNFATNALSRTVNTVENRLDNLYFDFRICHASCHYSCHGSRGRR